MRAMAIEEASGPERLRISDLPKPDIVEEGHVRGKVVLSIEQGGTV